MRIWPSKGSFPQFEFYFRWHCLLGSTSPEYFKFGGEVRLFEKLSNCEHSLLPLIYWWHHGACCMLHEGANTFHNHSTMTSINGNYGNKKSGDLVVFHLVERLCTGLFSLRLTFFKSSWALQTVKNDFISFKRKQKLFYTKLPTEYFILSMYFSLV